MPFRKDFFNNFCLRASQRGVLNDPFELSPAQEFIDKVIKEGLSDDFFEKAEQYSLNGNFNEIGVISFTENYNNLLMWSHYASEHKGIVVEFDYEKLSYYFNYKFSSKNTIERVLYNRERYSPLQSNVSVKELLLTKSDDWIYEKEHRILSSLMKADMVSVDTKLFRKLHEFYDDLYIDLFDVINTNDERTSFKVNSDECIELDNKELYGSATDDEEEMNSSHSESVLNEIYSSLAVLPSSIFLFELPSECISSIFLGCRVSEEEQNSLSKLIGNKNIPIFKAKLSKTHFSLDFEEVYI
ncbi:DUF2971 domain-containing protein [Thalassotalea agariperforans]